MQLLQLMQQVYVTCITCDMLPILGTTCYLCYVLLLELWDVTGTSVERHLAYNDDYEVFYTQLKFTVDLKRKPLFYIINIVVPFLLLITVVLMVTASLKKQKNTVALYRVQICNAHRTMGLVDQFMIGFLS